MGILKNINEKFKNFFDTVGEGHKELWETDDVPTTTIRDAKLDDKLYVCPIADECELDIKEDCTHKVPHEWNFNCPNELHTTDGKMIENHKCPLKGCIEIPAVDIAEAAKKVVDEMIAMPDDEFNEEIRKAKEELNCQPNTCHGECNGTGNCKIATEWQEKIHVDNRVFVKFKKKGKKYKNKKQKWQNIQNRNKKKKKHKRKRNRRK